MREWSKDARYTENEKTGYESISADRAVTTFILFRCLKAKKENKKRMHPISGHSSLSYKFLPDGNLSLENEDMPFNMRTYGSPTFGHLLGEGGKFFLLLIFNCSWVDTRWQQHSTHLRTNSTQNAENGTYITVQKKGKKKLGKLGLCPIFASYTLAFALQLGKKHRKTWVKVVEKCPNIPVGVVQYTFTQKQYTQQHNETIHRTYITILHTNIIIYKQIIRIYEQITVKV
jgi:hypothetical protein